MSMKMIKVLLREVFINGPLNNDDDDDDGGDVEGCGVDVWAGVLNEDVIGGTTDDEYDDDDDDDDDDERRRSVCGNCSWNRLSLNGENLISTNTFQRSHCHQHP